MNKKEMQVLDAQIVAKQTQLKQVLELMEQSKKSEMLLRGAITGLQQLKAELIKASQPRKKVEDIPGNG